MWLTARVARRYDTAQARPNAALWTTAVGTRSCTRRPYCWHARLRRGKWRRIMVSSVEVPCPGGEAHEHALEEPAGSGKPGGELGRADEQSRGAESGRTSSETSEYCVRFHPRPDAAAGRYLTQIWTLCTKSDVYPPDRVAPLCSDVSQCQREPTTACNLDPPLFRLTTGAEVGPAVALSCRQHQIASEFDNSPLAGDFPDRSRISGPPLKPF
jgi:hypothetical protein